MPEREPYRRGIYESDEVRVPLANRVNGPWTEFEAMLFNLVTMSGDRPHNLIFSRRLKVVQQMLEAFDKETM